MGASVTLVLKQPSNGFVVGVVVGVLVITLLNVFGVDFGNGDAKPRVAVTTSAAADAFVGDWSRMRNGTWAVESTFTRTADNGQQYTTNVHQAQSPPDSIREDARTADVTLEGQHYVCAAPPTSATPASAASVSEEGKYTSCRRVGMAPTFQSQAASDIASVRNDVVGDNRRYDVQKRAGDCYGLYLRPTPNGTIGQWGTQGEVCFDAKTGAVNRTEVTRPGVTDTVVATSIRAELRDDEIRLPAPIVQGLGS